MDADALSVQEQDRSTGRSDPLSSQQRIMPSSGLSPGKPRHGTARQDVPRVAVSGNIAAESTSLGPLGRRRTPLVGV